MTARRRDAADVDEAVRRVLVALAAVDVREAVDDRLGLDVHADDVELGLGGGGEELVDHLLRRRHHDHFVLRFLVLVDLAGDDVPQQRVRRVDRQLAAQLPTAAPSSSLRVVSLGMRRCWMNIDRRRAARGPPGGRGTCRCASRSRTVSTKKWMPRGRVVADVARDVRAGGGDEA